MRGFMSLEVLFPETPDDGVCLFRSSGKDLPEDDYALLESYCVKAGCTRLVRCPSVLTKPMPARPPAERSRCAVCDESWQLGVVSVSQPSERPSID